MLCLDFIWRFAVRRYVGWREWQQCFYQSGCRLATLLGSRVSTDFARLQQTTVKNSRHGKGGERPVNRDSKWSPDARRFFDVATSRWGGVVGDGAPSGPDPPQSSPESTPASTSGKFPGVKSVPRIKNVVRSKRKKQKAEGRAQTCIWMGGLRYELARIEGLTKSEQPLATDCFCRGLELGLFAPKTEETEEFRVQMVRKGLKIQNSS